MRSRFAALAAPAVVAGGLHAIVLCLLLLHLYVWTLPPTPAPIPAPEDLESAWWGLWPITCVPAWALGAGALAVLASIVYGWRRFPAPEGAPAAPQRGKRALLAAAALLVIAFFAFPVAHTRWGDAYMLAHGLAWPDPALRITHSWQAPLDVFLHSRVWLALGPALGWEDAVPVYRLLSPLAGALYLGAALALGDEQRSAPAWLGFGLLASLGVLQLFFGYVENYSFAAAGVLAYLWLGLRAAEGRGALWPAAVALALTNALHPSTAVLAPSLLWLGWRAGRQGNISWRSIVLQIGLPVLLIGASVFVWMEASGHGLDALLRTDRPGGQDARWFVPLAATESRWEHYTMFSWPHLRDFLNEQLLVAPVVLPALIWLGVCRWAGRGRTDGAESRTSGARTAFLAVAAAAYLLFAWVWNPDYGGQRDWDLFSLAAIPAAALLTAVLPCALRRRGALLAGALPLIVLQALHTAAWVYSNTLPWEWP